MQQNELYVGTHMLIRDVCMAVVVTLSQILYDVSMSSFAPVADCNSATNWEAQIKQSQSRIKRCCGSSTLL